MDGSKKGWFSNKSRTIMGMVWIFFVVLILSGISEVAYSLSVYSEGETSLDIDVQLKYALGVRARDPRSTFLMNPNTDDAERNFERWDLINNRFSTILDMELKYKNFGVFIRPRAYYDFVYTGDNSNDSPATVNKTGPHDEFIDYTEDLHGKRAEILDAFAYINFDIGGHAANLRAGRLFVNWGENLFIGNNISGSMSPVDATMLTSPGMEFKEALLPVGQVYTDIKLFDNVSLGAYYQWEWDKTRIDESGAFFSAADFAFYGGQFILGPGGMHIPNLGIQEPDHSGQWGARVKYFVDWGEGMDFGFYYLNYHDKGPMVIGTIAGGMPGYYYKFAEDIKLYGFSLSTQIEDAAVGMEITYREDFPLGVADPTNPLGSGYEMGKVFQIQTGVIYMTPPGPFYDQLMIQGEVGYNQVSGYGGKTLLKGSTLADDKAWGGTVQVVLLYYNFIPGIDLNLSVPFSYKFNPDGISPVGGTFSEGADSWSAFLKFTYKQIYFIDIGYNGYLGTTKENSFTDRDYISLSFKYTF